MDYHKINRKMFFVTLMFLISFVFIIFQFFVYVKNEKYVRDFIKNEKTYTSGKTIFLGDSITDGYDLDKYFMNDDYINKGIGGNTTLDILDRLKEDVIDYNPSKIILLIGTNDKSNQGINKEDTIENIGLIVGILKSELPNTLIYIESIYPVDEDRHKNRSNEDFKYINTKIEALCEELDNVSYIDLYDDLLKDDKLNSDYTDDGLHLNHTGYIKVTNILNEYLNK